MLDVGATPDLDEDERTVRRAFAGGSLCVAGLAPLWVSLYAVYGEVGPGSSPAPTAS